jgi:hypothetical protein
VFYNAVHVGRVHVEPHDILKRETGVLKHGLKIVEGCNKLGLQVARVQYFPVRIDGSLTGAIENPLSACNLNRLRKTELILPRPRIDNCLLRGIDPLVRYSYNYFIDYSPVFSLRNVRFGSAE